MRVRLRNFGAELRRRPTVATLGRGLFVAAVLLLVALGVWWMVLLDRSLATEHRLLRQNLGDTASVLVARLRVERSLPAVGPFAEDPRFDVVDGPVTAPELAAVIEAPLRLRAGAAALDRLEEHYARKRLMLVGEGVLLCSLLLVVVAMLYRLFRAERRFHDEIEAFLSRVTHDMKTPLAGIKAVLQTIESGRMPADRLIELSGRALREVDRQEAMVQNLLLAQRLRIGARLAAEPIDVAALVDAIVATRRDLPHGPTIGTSLPGRIDATIDGSAAGDCAIAAGQGAVALGDAAALRSILDNLLDNASKYGGKAIEVEVAVEPSVVVVRVRDDGIGFDPARAARLFAAFVRDPGGVQRKGTGLGLWIARGLAESMAGELTARSDGPGLGATFELRLPRPALADRAAMAYAAP